MLKKFTSEYIRENQGCYKGTKKTDNLLKKTGNNPTLLQLLKELPPKDFIWFLNIKCELTIEEKLEFSIFCAELIIPIFEARHKGDAKYRNSVYLTKALYYEGITIETFLADNDCMYANANAYAYNYNYNYATATTNAYAHDYARRLRLRQRLRLRPRLRQRLRQRQRPRL